MSPDEVKCYCALKPRHDEVGFIDPTLNRIMAEETKERNKRSVHIEQLKFEDNAEKPASALATQIGGSHYSSMKIQFITYIYANNIGFLEGNVIKYVSRWREKNGIEDLRKASHYLDMLIEMETSNDEKA